MPITLTSKRNDQSLWNRYIFHEKLDECTTKYNGGCDKIITLFEKNVNWRKTKLKNSKNQ